MNVLLPSRLPLPSPSLPYNCVPFRIHQYVCDALDLTDKWKELPRLLYDRGIPIRLVDSERIFFYDEKTPRNPTTYLLDYLCEERNNELTVGDLASALEGECEQLAEQLWKYAEGRISESECKKELRRSSVTVDLRKSKPLQLCALIPHSAHYLLERGDMISLIRNKFNSLLDQSAGLQSSDQILSVVLEGDPGVGKSQIARQFGEWFYQNYTNSGKSVIVYTLHAGNLEELFQSYLEFAEFLGIKNLDLFRNDAMAESFLTKLDQLVMLVGDVLCMCENWLIIVDNVETRAGTKTEKEIFDFIPYTSNQKMYQWGGGMVLITMQQRNKFEDGPYFKVVHQEALKLQLGSAVQLLLNVEKGQPQNIKVISSKDQHVVRPDDSTIVTDTNTDAFEVEEQYEGSEIVFLFKVAKKLEQLPLALVSAAEYKRMKMKDDSSYSWKKYLTEIVNAMRYSVREYKQSSLAAAVGITLQKLCESELYQLTFVVLAYCEGKNVPEGLVRDYVSTVTKKNWSLLYSSRLSKCPLLSVTSRNDKVAQSAAAVHFYHMHGVTHSILKHEVLSSSSGRRSVIKKENIPNLQILLKVSLGYQASLKHSNDLRTLSYLTPHLFSVGNAAVAEYELLCDSRRAHDCQWPEIPEVLFVAVESCQFSSKSSQEQVEHMKTCYHLSQDIDTVSMASEAKYLSSLGHCISSAGDDDTAREKGYEALAMMEKTDAKGKDFAYSLITLSWNMRPEYKRGIATIRHHIGRVVTECGGESVEYATLLYQLGDLVKKFDRVAAREYFEKSLFILESRGEKYKLQFTSAAGFYCRFLLTSWSSADLLEAAALGESIMRITEQLINKDTMSYINRCSTMGRMLMSTLQPRRAIGMLSPLVKKVKRHKQPGAQWRIQQPMWIAYALLGDFETALTLLKDNIRLAAVHSIDVSRADRKLNNSAAPVLHVAARAAKCWRAVSRRVLFNRTIFLFALFLLGLVLVLML